MIKDKIVNKLGWDIKDKYFIIILLCSSILIGVLFSTSPIILIIIILVLALGISFLNPDISLFLFIASIPIEFFLKDNFSLVIKLTGAIAFLSKLLQLIIFKRRIKWDIPLILMIAYVFWAFVSFFWSQDRTRAFTFFTSYALLTGLYFLIINQEYSDKTIKLISYALSLGGICLAISGIYQIVNNTYFLNIRRVVGATNDQNYYFMLSISLFPFFYYVINKVKKNYIKFIISLFIILLLYTDLYTKSRAGLITLFLFGLIYMLFQKHKKRILLLLFAIALFVLVFAPIDYWDRFASMKDLSSDDMNRVTLIWPQAIKAFFQRPINGYGIGNGEIYLREITSVPLYLASSYVLSAHNVYLGITLDLGIIGLFLYLGFIILPTRNLFLTIINKNRYKIPRIEYYFSILVISVIISYLFYIFQGGGMETRKILWLFMGICTIMSYRNKSAIKIV